MKADNNDASEGDASKASKAMWCLIYSSSYTISLYVSFLMFEALEFRFMCFIVIALLNFNEIVDRIIVL